MTWPNTSPIGQVDLVALLPEFSNPADYPPALISVWSQIAYAQLNPTRFGSQIDLAAAYFIAHNLVLSKREVGRAAVSAPVGDAQGPVSSKSVGPVSISYDAGLQGMAGAGPYNATVYGQRLYSLMSAFCSGPVYRAPRRRPFLGPIFTRF